MKVKILWIACILLFLATQSSYGQRAKPNNVRKAAMVKKKMGMQKNKTKNALRKKKKEQASRGANTKYKTQRKKKQGNASQQENSKATAGQERGSVQKSRIKAISSLQLSDDLLLQLDSVQVHAFHVDELGILRPNPGYRMGFHAAQNKIFIKPVGIKFDKSILQHVSEEIALGILVSCLGCEGCDIAESPNSEGDGDSCKEFITITLSPEIQQIE